MVGGRIWTAKILPQAILPPREVELFEVEFGCSNNLTPAAKTRKFSFRGERTDSTNSTYSTGRIVGGG